ncbi:nurim homolog isoform X2 [Ornithodoros turicata]|uniref:nurim homolog isoform X2 n=1 Tax=Ornithodoros turicata TaxID=34597 RepID=UPI0031398D85
MCGIVVNHGSQTQPLWWNCVLVAQFCLQHSVMCNSKATERLEKCFGVLTRSAYIIATCVCLKVLMTFWSRSNQFVLWEVDTSENPLLWWCFTAVHVVGWLIIYTGCLLMDIGELLGVKQVYYSMASFYQPRNLKARSLNRYYSHMRHPSFIVMCLLLFVHPVMRIDRFLLAAFMAIYTFVRYNIDVEDYEYIKDLYETKRSHMKKRL